MKHLFEYYIICLLMLLSSLVWLGATGEPVAVTPSQSNPDSTMTSSLHLKDSIMVQAIARFHVKRLEKFLDLKDLMVGQSYELFHLGKKKSSLYDVKIVSSSGENRGYVVVNLDKNEFPVPEFMTTGPSITEQFRKQTGRSDQRIVWINPTYILAMDAHGQIVAQIGEDPAPDKKHDKADRKVAPRGDALSAASVMQRRWCNRHKVAVAEAWSLVGSGAKPTRDVVEDEPWGNYSIGYAEGYMDDASHFSQIPPNTGANGKSYYSGCSATAWATLLSWHDLNWTPELLRGSQRSNYISWGNPSEGQLETYMDRVMMDMGRKRYLDVHDCSWVSGNAGITHDGDMERGFDYITNELEHSFSNRKTGDDDLQAVYDRLIIDRRPVLIKTPNHFSVAAGFWYDMDGDDHYFLIKTGWRDNPEKWIKAEYLEAYWYLKDISPRKQAYIRTFPPTQFRGPVLCTTLSATGLHDVYNVFWLSDKGYIYHLQAQGELPQTFAFTDAKILPLPQSAIYTPAVSADPGGRMYLIWVDTMHVMHLLRWEDPTKGWNSLEFPTLTTYTRPAIVGSQGAWLTVAFLRGGIQDAGVQVISTCRDVQRPGAWPSELFPAYPYTDCYWELIDITSAQWLSMESFNSETVLTWGRGYTTSFWSAKSDGTDSYIVDLPDYYNSEMLTLAVSNKTLFAAAGSDIYRVTLQRRITGTRPPTSGSGTYDIPAKADLSRVATLKFECVDGAALSSLELEDGKHPQLLLGWGTRTWQTNLIHLRLLSIDYSGAMLDYTNKPY